MARSTMEVAFLGTQRFDGEGGVKYIKVFYGDDPDGKTEHGLSIIGMAADESAAEEIFAAGAHFDPLQKVRITFDVARGGQNKGKNLALHLEAVERKPSARNPNGLQGQSQGQQNKSADSDKA